MSSSTVAGGWGPGQCCGRVLCEQGADSDRLVTQEMPDTSPNLDMATANSGELCLRDAAWNGNVGLVRLLLHGYSADPNTTDDKGWTPLLAAFTNPHAHACVEVVRLLLEAGADPALAQQDGITPLHKVAEHGRMDLVDTIYSRAPATINCSMATGETALFEACRGGHESMVAKLLSLGAMQPMPFDLFDREECPLAIAVSHGFLGVVRVLLQKEGLTAVGGERALPFALTCAIQYRQLMIFRLLLTVGGERMRAGRANTKIKTRRLLHYAAAYLYPAAVTVLLNYGADEAAKDSVGNTARDNIGERLHRVGAHVSNPWDGVAVRRMLDRGQAYRARSWAWPLDDPVDGGSGGGDGSDPPGVADVATVLWSWYAMIFPPDYSLRICRPKVKSKASVAFVTLIGGYCTKG